MQCIVTFTSNRTELSCYATALKKGSFWELNITYAQTLKNKLTYFRLLSFQGLLSIPCPAAFGKVVDCGKLNKCWKHKGIANGNKPIHGGGIRHFGKRVAGADAEGGHGQHCSHTCDGSNTDIKNIIR